MKRALSLIIVLAMVLCMIPFSAFAADFGTGEDFADGTTITLTADSQMTYLWTATEDGTLEILTEEVIAEGAESTGVEPDIKVDGADYTEAFAVTAGESYEITISDGAMVGGTVKVWTKFVGLPGTETNPHLYYNPASGLAPADQAATTVSVDPGASVYYKLIYYTGNEVTISGNGVKVVKGEETVDGSEAGSVTFTFASNDVEVLIKITNKSEAAATYTITGVAPNSYTNPEVVESGEYDHDFAAGADAYFYKYIAEGDGTVSVGVAASTTVVDAETSEETVVELGWQYAIYQIDRADGTYAYGDTHWSDDTPVVNPETVEVSTGDVLNIWVNTYDPAGTNPAGTVTTTITFEAAPEEPEEPEEPAGPIVIESLPYTHEEAFSGEYSQEFSYTNNTEETFYLFVKADNGGQASTNPWWGMKEYNGGIVYQLEPGASVTVMAYSYDSEMPANIYSFDKITEIEPDGSYDFPYAWGSLLNGPVAHTNEGATTVNYIYEAEKDGKIYHGQWDSVYDMVAGETLSVSIEPGETVELYYLSPVATVDGVDYYDLQAAINAAAEIATGEATVEIKMLTDYTTDGTIIIPANVIVNIATKNLTVGYLFVLNGGNIYADGDGRYNGSNFTVCGKITTSKNNVVITSDVAVITNTNNNMSAIPVYLPNDDCYVFINQRVYDYSYTLDKENHTIEYKWRMTGSGAFTNEMKNGGLDNGIRYCVKVSWFTGLADADLSFWYTEDIIKTVAGSTSQVCTFAMGGLDDMGANYAEKEAYDTFEVRAAFVTDCGVCAYGLTK